MRDIHEKQSTNVVNIIGKVLDTTYRQGKTSAGMPYESVAMTVRVTQNIEGRVETSEIPISIFGTQYTSTNKPNPLYATVQETKNLNTAQNVGIDAADVVRLSKASLQENFFTTKSGTFVDSWQLRGSFCNHGNTNATEMATFNVDIFILDMHDEVDRDGDPTGRLIVRGGIVQWGGKLDVVEFIVEAPDKVDYLQRNWEINKTVNAVGRIRYTTKEDKPAASTSSWGEVLPETTSVTVRELIITGGSDEPFDDEFGYDPMDIKKAFNERKALIEQSQMEAKSSSSKASSAAKPNKYDWE